jgi:hypothetical protein
MAQDHLHPHQERGYAPGNEKLSMKPSSAALLCSSCFTTSTCFRVLKDLSMSILESSTRKSERRSSCPVEGQEGGRYRNKKVLQTEWRDCRFLLLREEEMSRSMKKLAPAGGPTKEGERAWEK